MTDLPKDADVLPIESSREQILHHIQQNRVTFIQGDTGCGKSSMVPIFLLREDPSRRIFVSQPCRIAATSLAKYVGQQLGNAALVGYRVGQGGRRESPETRITCCTPGYLLQFLSFTPTAAQSLTHIILDEMHDRSVDSDMLLLLTKFLLLLYPKLKLIIMSATLETPLFTDYFAQFQTEIFPLHAGGSRYPVQRIFLDEMHNVPGIRPRAIPSYVEALRSLRLESPILAEPMQKVLIYLLKRLMQPDTCILVFLPGLAEIDAVQTELRDNPPSCACQVLPLHAILPSMEQERVMKPIPSSTCRIVLATNLAESSVTIPYVTHVIDSCLQRSPALDPTTNKPTVVCHWISQASATQRAGRTGRVVPGVAIQMVTREFFNTLEEHDLPEIMNVPLDKTVATAMVSFKQFGPVDRLLGKLLAPPPREQVASALISLHQCGAITSPISDAEVTIIGRLAAILPLEVPLVRLVLMGYATGILAEAIVIAACHMQGSLFTAPSRLFIQDSSRFISSLTSNFEDRLRMDGGRYSEPLAALNLYITWLKRNKCSISISRAQAADLTVSNICRTLLSTSILPLDATAVRQLGLLDTLAQGRSGHAGEVDHVFRRIDPNLLYFMLGSSGAMHFLQPRIHVQQPLVQLAEQHGMALSHVALVRSEHTVVLKAEEVLAAVDYPHCKAKKVVLVPSDDPYMMNALVELHPVMDDEDTSNASSMRLTVHDLPLPSKVLHQVYLHSRRALPYLRQHRSIEAKALAFPYMINWASYGTSGNQQVLARMDARSSLATLADFNCARLGWNPPLAVALSILSLGSSEDNLALGVTVLPSGAFSALMQLIMAPKVARMQVSFTNDKPENGTDGDAPKSFLIATAEFTCYGDGRHYVSSFRPYLLNATHLQQVNEIRKGLGNVLSGDMSEVATLRLTVAALLADLYSSGRQPNLETLRDSIAWLWYGVQTGNSDDATSSSDGKDLLPPLSITESWNALRAEELRRGLVVEPKVSKRQQMYENLRLAVHEAVRSFPEGVGQAHFMKIKTFNGQGARHRRHLLGYVSLRNLLESMPDIVNVEDSLADTFGYTVTPVPGAFIKTKEEPKKFFPLSSEIATEILETVHPEAWTAEQCHLYKFFYERVRSTITEHERGLLLSDFQRIAGFCEKGIKEKRLSLGFVQPKSLLRSMPGLVFLQALRDHKERYAVYPASLMPKDGELSAAWLEGRLKMEIFAEIANSVPRKTTTIAGGIALGISVEEFRTPFLEGTDGANKDQPMEALDTGLVNSGLLSRLATQIWTLGHNQKFVEFRTLMQKVMKRYPKGLSYEQLTTIPGLKTPELQSLRAALGFRTVWDLILSISDIVTLYPSNERSRWIVVPAQPTNWDGTPRPTPTIEPFPLDEINFPVPAWAFTVLPPMPGDYGRGHRGIHPEYINIRNIVTRHIKDYPNGVNFVDFGRSTGILSLQSRRIRKAIGCVNLVKFLSSMEDLVQIVKDPDDYTGYLLFPAGVEIPELKPSPAALVNRLAWRPPPDPEDLLPVPQPEASYYAAFQPLKIDSEEEGWRTLEEEWELGYEKLPDLGHYPVLAYFWTNKQKRDYNDFRKHITRVFRKKYPYGCRAQFFISTKGINGKKARRRRLNLGFLTIWDFLQSMPDLVQLDTSSPDVRDWKIYPGWVTPGTEPPELPAVPTEEDRVAALLEATKEEGYYARLRRKIKEAIQMMEAEMDEPEEVAFNPRRWIRKKWTELPIRWAVFRDIVEAGIVKYPHGVDVITFGVKSGLGSPKWAEDRKELGFVKLTDMLREMPDLVYLAEHPTDPSLLMVYPAATAPKELSEDAAARLKDVDMNGVRSRLKLQNEMLSDPLYPKFQGMIQKWIQEQYPNGVALPRSPPSDGFRLCKSPPTQPSKFLPTTQSPSVPLPSPDKTNSVDPIPTTVEPHHQSPPKLHVEDTVENPDRTEKPAEPTYAPSFSRWMSSHPAILDMPMPHIDPPPAPRKRGAPLPPQCTCSCHTAGYLKAGYPRPLMPSTLANSVAPPSIPSYVTDACVVS